MKRPHLSTGAWIFCSVALASIATPVGVYAATAQTVSIGNNTGSSAVATVTTQHQLLTATEAPNKVIRFEGQVPASTCKAVYTPPAGMALVVTQVTYDIGTGTAGNEAYGYVTGDCEQTGADAADSTDAYHSEEHTFPTGLPLAAVDFDNLIGDSGAFIFGTGYLIPAAQVPPAPLMARGPDGNVPAKLGGVTVKRTH